MKCMVRGILMAEFRELEVFDLITLSATANARALGQRLAKMWTEVMSFTPLIYVIIAGMLLVNNLMEKTKKTSHTF